MKIMIINGPNMNMLGIREKDIYGTFTYEDLCEKIKAKFINQEITFFQSNSEGEIINAIHRAYFDEYDGIVINPAAFTHYSYAIYDALNSINNIPKIEVHLTNIYAREEFRTECITTKASDACICGLGTDSYIYAIDALIKGLYGKKN